MNMVSHIFRLKPGQDLKKEILNFVVEHNIEAATIVAGIGSLLQANVRLATDPQGTLFQKKFEVLTLMGTASKSGGLHLHISLSDAEGKTLGGHLMDGSLIFTTAEITLLEHKDKIFLREPDESTGYLELVVKNKNGPF